MFTECTVCGAGPAGKAVHIRADHAEWCPTMTWALSVMDVPGGSLSYDGMGAWDPHDPAAATAAWKRRVEKSLSKG